MRPCLAGPLSHVTEQYIKSLLEEFPDIFALPQQHATPRYAGEGGSNQVAPLIKAAEVEVSSKQLQVPQHVNC